MILAEFNSSDNNGQQDEIISLQVLITTKPANFILILIKVKNELKY